MLLRDKLLKNSTIGLTAPILESKVFGPKNMALTPVPMINVALSGKINGGLVPGLLTLAGPSKHFKTAFALMMITAFQKKYKEGIILFYDSEFGSPQSYFESFDVDMDRVVHTPITDVEELKFDISRQLKELEKKDDVMIVIDSIGNLASRKEVDDALDGKSVADMTRAKQFKSLFRIITPHLNLKDIPMVVVNHTYKEIGMFPKDIVSGGTGSYYSSDAIWIVGRQQKKSAATGPEIDGYNFIINIEKSRYVKEKSKLPITVTFKGGIRKFSGLVEIGLRGGYIVKPKNGWYDAVNPETGEVLFDKSYRENELLDDNKFWGKVFKDTDFANYIEKFYRINTESILNDDE